MPSASEPMENYFNYFTEIEECFQRYRGTRTLLSPLDWALVESWKEAGVPLPAVLAGIARSFEKYRKRPQPFRKVNSVAYCSQEVLQAADEARLAAVQGGSLPGKPHDDEESSAPPFPADELLRFLNQNAAALDRASQQARESGQPVVAGDLASSATALRDTAKGRDWSGESNLQELERSLTALEERIESSLKRAASVESLSEISRKVDRGLVPYRHKMTGPQIESLERQFTKRALFERYKIPRLSLFYL